MGTRHSRVKKQYGQRHKGKKLLCVCVHAIMYFCVRKCAHVVCVCVTMQAPLCGGSSKGWGGGQGMQAFLDLKAQE